MNKKDIFQKLGLFLLPIITRLVFLTLRIKIIKPDNFKPKSNYVLMFWHGTMIGPWYFHRKKNFTAVVSSSKDGEILSSALATWKYELIRGSSSVDSKIVFKKMIEALNNGKNLAITPDGPRGEIFKMKIGGLISAVRTQKEIVLCGVAYYKRFIFNSWDKFEFPKPFTRVALVFSEPYFFPQNLTNEEYEKIRNELEIDLNCLKAKALISFV